MWRRCDLSEGLTQTDARPPGCRSPGDASAVVRMGSLQRLQCLQCLLQTAASAVMGIALWPNYSSQRDEKALTLHPPSPSRCHTLTYDRTNFGDRDEEKYDLTFDGWYQDLIADVKIRSRRWLVAINRFAGHSCETAGGWDIVWLCQTPGPAQTTRQWVLYGTP